mmetsp:Transcript_129695/g.225302  ORF Transcript_129695/g.225302 Transcript_129695/m.225302 type:complete len:307 (-) Transcript_129695:107-1027(-)
MATLTLNIRHLSGLLTHIEVSPETLVSELDKKMRLPALHKAEFFAGESQLVREARIKEVGLASDAEVQFVAIMPDASMVIAVLESLVVPMSGCCLLQSHAEARFLPAVKLLDQMEEISSKHCPELLSLVRGPIMDTVIRPWALANHVEILGRQNKVDVKVDTEIGGIHCCIDFQEGVRVVAAKALGRACDDALQMVKDLIAGIGNQSIPAEYAIVALGELASRHPEVMQGQPAEPLVGFISTCCAPHSTCFRAAKAVACFLLGQIGDCTAMLALEWLGKTDSKLSFAADQALLQIAARARVAPAGG